MTFKNSKRFIVASACLLTLFAAGANQVGAQSSTTIASQVGADPSSTAFSPDPFTTNFIPCIRIPVAPYWICNPWAF